MPRSIQLAIQGGGAKICHLLAAMEAIQELERLDELKVTRIAGTSAGAIVACMYAAKIDFAGFRTTLQSGLGQELLDLFHPPNVLAMAYSFVTGVTRRVDSGVQLQTAPGLNHTGGWANECDVVLEPSLPVLH